ncbi:MAG: zinc ribbon domain-containing protein, partial [Tetragenococcus koreensis]|nr:zinc ribbon domain-containing protein [Tetragenococcus koreensis]
MKKNIICPQCGTSNTSENIFCSECGTPLKQESPPKGEPKTVTNRRVNHSKPIKKIIGSICVGLLVVAGGVTAVVIYHNEQIQNQKTAEHQKLLSIQASKEKEQSSSSLSEYKKLQNVAISSVDKAYNTKSSDDISSAQDAISKLKKSDQSSLSERLKNLTDQISKENETTSKSSSEENTTTSSQEQTNQPPILKKEYKASGNILRFYPNPVGQADGVYRIDTANDDGTANMGMWSAYKQVGNIIYDS